MYSTTGHYDDGVSYYLTTTFNVIMFDNWIDV